MRARFLEVGGVIYEGAAFHTAEVYPEGVVIRYELIAFSNMCLNPYDWRLGLIYFPAAYAKLRRSCRCC